MIIPPDDSVYFAPDPCRDYEDHVRRITVPTGTTTRTEHLYRAYPPDGRIRDTEPLDARADGQPFGRLRLPWGTRIERFTREITVTATVWASAGDPEWLT